MWSSGTWQLAILCILHEDWSYTSWEMYIMYFMYMNGNPYNNSSSIWVQVPILPRRKVKHEQECTFLFTTGQQNVLLVYLCRLGAYLELTALFLMQEFFFKVPNKSSKHWKIFEATTKFRPIQYHLSSVMSWVENQIQLTRIHTGWLGVVGTCMLCAYSPCCWSVCVPFTTQPEEERTTHQSLKKKSGQVKSSPQFTKEEVT